MEVTRNYAEISWVLKYINAFEEIAHLTHERFMEINNTENMIGFLFELYDVGHTMSASRVLQCIYERLSAYDELVSFDDDLFEELNLW